MIYLLDNDKFIYSEVMIFKLCLNWAKSHHLSTGESIETIISPLLPYIRFGCMSSEEIATVVSPAMVLSKSDLLELLLFVGSNGVMESKKFKAKSRQVNFLPFFKSNFLFKSSEVINSTVCLKSGDHYYYSLMITSTGILTCNKWDGSCGGKLLLKVQKLVIEKGGVIDLTGVGYRSGKCSQKKKISR
jgi:hypothetical protein